MMLPIIDGFQLEAYLGEGGMGVVYRAREHQTDRLVALKMLSRVDPAGIYRLKREFRTLAGIIHPNLVRLDEFHSSRGMWFFTMELVSGSAFLDHLGVNRWGQLQESATETEPIDGLARTQPLQSIPEPPKFFDEALLRQKFLQLVQGIGAVHQARKLHCDIKPSNLLVDEHGRVVVLDFGVSSGFGPQEPFRTVEGEVAGTPEYMSPEQAAGQPIGPPSDWYAVGVVLYESLCGTLPFAGSKFGIMRQKQHETAVPPRAFQPDLPRDLEALCLDLLATSPDDRPGEAEILDRLAATTPTRRTSRPPAPWASNTFVGRTAELAVLNEAAREVGASRPVVVFVSGNSGIGKSTLIQRFLEEMATKPSVVVLRGRCYERESVPYKAIDPIIDELSRFLRRLTDREVAELLPRDVHALGRIFPVLNRVRAVAAARGRSAEGADLLELRGRAARALKEFLARLADRWTVVLCIDDLQWGDVDSARALLELFEPPDAPSILVVLGARDGESTESPMLKELRAGAGAESFEEIVRHLYLNELDTDDAMALARNLLGSTVSSAVAQTVARESRGNPFFVRELSTYASSTPWEPGLEGAEADLRLDVMLRERVTALPGDLQRMLEVVAVAAHPVPQSALFRLARDQGMAASTWLDLRDKHLVRMTGGATSWSVECFHDRVREAVSGLLSPARTKDCHRLLASALEESGSGDPEILLDHYCRAGELELARKHVLTSAKAAMDALAFSRAARLYRLALELIPAEEWQDLNLEHQLAIALVNDGQLLEAAQVYERAAEKVPGEAGLVLRRLSAQHFLTSGHLEQGIVVLKRVLADVGLAYPKSPGAVLGRIAWHRAQLRLRGLDFRRRTEKEVPPRDLARADACFSAAVGLSMSDFARTAAFSAQHLVLALKTGEPMRIARGLAFEMGVAPGAGEEGLRWASRALPVAERLTDGDDDAYRQGLFFLAQGFVAYVSCQWKTAIDWLGRADKTLRKSEIQDVQWALLSCRVLTTISAAVSGDLAAVERQLPAISKEARQRGELHSLALMAYPGVMLNLARDRPEAAERLLSTANPDPVTDVSHFRAFNALHCALLIDRYIGNDETAWERISQQWPAILRSKILVVNVVRVSAMAERGSAALSVAVGRNREKFIRIAKQCAKKLARERLPHARAFGSLLEARIANALGDSASALEALNQAALQLDSAGLSVHAQCARRSVGILMGGAMGRGLVSEIDSVLLDLGVRNPARFASMMAPGFGGDPPALAN